MTISPTDVFSFGAPQDILKIFKFSWMVTIFETSNYQICSLLNSEDMTMVSLDPRQSHSRRAAPLKTQPRMLPSPYPYSSFLFKNLKPSPPNFHYFCLAHISMWFCSSQSEEDYIILIKFIKCLIHVSSWYAIFKHTCLFCHIYIVTLVYNKDFIWNSLQKWNSFCIWICCLVTNPHFF